MFRKGCPVLKPRRTVWSQRASLEISTWSRIQKLSISTRQGNLGNAEKTRRDHYLEPVPSKLLNQDKLLNSPPFLALHLRGVKDAVGFPAISPWPLTFPSRDKALRFIVRHKSLEIQMPRGIYAKWNSSTLKYHPLITTRGLVTWLPKSFSSPFPPQMLSFAALCASLPALRWSPNQ